MTEDKHMPKKAKKLKAIGKAITDIKLKQCLTRYTYRHRLAVAFFGLNADAIGKRTLEGYSIAVKLFLAYSAYDEIREAEKILRNTSRARQHKVIDFRVANQLRRNKELRILLENSVAVTNETLRKNLRRFYRDGNNEVMCVATAIRNCFAHGDFTAGGAGLNTKTACKAIGELADVVVQTSEEIFNEILS